MTRFSAGSRCCGEQTVDGFGAMLGTNVLGPFAFTSLVADQVRERVVIVGSDAHRGASLDLDDLQLTRGWRPSGPTDGPSSRTCCGAWSSTVGSPRAGSP